LDDQAPSFLTTLAAGCYFNAPEIEMGLEYDKSVDIFSFGTVLALISMRNLFFSFFDGFSQNRKFEVSPC
jgi:collagenase-like PrtC family protease